MRRPSPPLAALVVIALTGCSLVVDPDESRLFPRSRADAALDAPRPDASAFDTPADASAVDTSADDTAAVDSATVDTPADDTPADDTLVTSSARAVRPASGSTRR